MITRNKIIKAYLCMSLIILAFVEIESAGSVPLKVLYYEQNKGYCLLTCSILIMIILFFLFKSSKKLDLVLLLLLIKCALDIIPIIRDGSLATSTFWYYYAMTLITPIIYYIFKQYTGRVSSIINYLSVFGLILIVQMIVTIVKNGYEYSSDLYKQFLRIPFAHSNIIGVALLAILVLRIRANRIRGINLAINGVYIIGLILTQSRGSWVFLIGWLLWVQIKKAKEEHKGKKIVIIIMGIVAVVSIFIGSESLQQILLSTTLSHIDFSKISSGRVDIWGLAVNHFLKKPWLGSGLGVTEYNIGREIIYTGVHNIILDYLVQCGIVGTVIYGLAIFNGLRLGDFRKASHEYKAVFLAIIVILFYSMVEVCYNHFGGIFLFWMLIGIYNGNYDGEKRRL